MSYLNGNIPLIVVFFCQNLADASAFLVLFLFLLQ